MYFIFLYVGGILFSNLYALYKHRNNYYYNAVGASGAVAAVLFASIFFDPWNMIYFFGILPIPGIIFAALYLVYSYQMSKKQTDNVADKLRKNGIDAAAMHSKKSQKARTDALSKFKTGKLRVLVATDLISRGIDIEFLPHVINYELPRSPKDYIHRIGRTGRAESSGEAISFVTPEDQHHFKIIQKKMGKWVTMIDSENLDLKGF
jgi:superfamily II DNA/RNA helicase